MVPTVKRMVSFGFQEDKAKKIRKLMEQFTANFPGGLSSSFRRVRPNVTMHKINAIMNGHGVEEIPKGHNDRSPEIMYVNMGDSYDTTVMYINGKFRIGNWGSIVESGRYS